MPPLPESTIKRQIMRFLRSLPGARDIKASPPGSVAGKLDISGYVRGIYIEIEVKKPGGGLTYSGKKIRRGKLTPLQAYNIKKLKAEGAIAGVAYSVEEAKEILEAGGLYNPTTSSDSMR